jgi:hypothetical protein
MRILFTVHLYGDFGTDQGAEGAAVAIGVFLQLDGMETLGIQLGGGMEVLIFTDRRAQEAFFAELPVDFYRSLQCYGLA